MPDETVALANELINKYFADAYVARMHIWYSAMRQVLDRLESKGFSEQQLGLIPMFKPAVTYSLDMLKSSYDTTKLNYLALAIENSILGNLDDSVCQLLWYTFSELAPLHLKLLILFNDVRHYYQELEREFPLDYDWEYKDFVEDCYIALSGQSVYYEQAWNELYLRKMVAVADLNDLFTVDSLTTEYGKAFVRFLTVTTD